MKIFLFRWNGPPPRCEVIECDPLPPNHKNSKIFTPNGTFFGSKAEIQCARGYKLDGPSQITCTETGQWSGPIPNCVEDGTATIRISTPSVPATTFSRTRAPSRKTTSSVRTSSRFSTSSTTTTTKATTSTTKKPFPIDLDTEEDKNDGDLFPGTVREEYPGRRPVITIPKSNNYPQTPTTSTTTRRIETTTKNVQEEIDAAHPGDNEVAGTHNNV